MPTQEEIRQNQEKAKKALEKRRRDRENFVNSFPTMIYVYEYTNRANNLDVFKAYTLENVGNNSATYRAGALEIDISLSKARSLKKKKAPMIRKMI